MMRFLILIFTILALQARGQYFPDAKRDNNWVFGQSENIGILGAISINFNTGIPVVSYPQIQINLCGANCNISDQNGQLLFFSNGFKVADRNGNIMPNGDSLSFGVLYLSLIGASPIAQGAIALPVPSCDNSYYLLHELLTDSVTWFNVVKKLQYSKINMSLNNGLGDVTEKNLIIIDDTLDYGGISACRHGNGRDWWIIVPKAYYDCYYFLLLDPSGLHLHHLKCFGEERIRDFALHTTSRFSPDGDYFIRLSVHYTNDPIYGELFSFDRCHGNISKVDDFWIEDIGGLAYAEFAPEGNLVYFSRCLYVYQANVNAPDFSQSITIIDTTDYYSDTLTPSLDMGFGDLLKGPDGKIYINSGTGNYFSVIENPDEPGTACNLQQHSMIFSKCYSGMMPNLPNFRLGRLIGSECDTIPAMGFGENISALPFTIKINGNPAGSTVQFEFNGPFSGQDMELAIYNIMGQEVQTFNIAPFQSILNLDVSGINNGLYLSVLRKNGKKLGEARFVVAK